MVNEASFRTDDGYDWSVRGVAFAGVLKVEPARHRIEAELLSIVDCIPFADWI